MDRWNFESYRCSQVTSDTQLIGFPATILFMLLCPIIAIVYTAYAVLFWLKERSKWAAYLFFVFFAPLNVAHNWIVCTILFLELPREGFTTTRLKRLKTSSTVWRRELADLIGGFLNRHDEGHY